MKRIKTSVTVAAMLLLVAAVFPIKGWSQLQRQQGGDNPLYNLAINLGEVILNGDRSKLDVTTDMQAFGLIITAEPYFAVRQPSNVVVMENVVRKDTVGKVEMIDAKYELLER